MKFLKGLKNKVVDTAKTYAKQRALAKVTKLLLKSRPDAVMLMEIAQLARDMKKGRK